ncbi:hypothetical protein M426DRAFT_220332 [Hypoxylon sp. CI-4A]|nr:hypothetical protein M426DRAFT_220332 [Hypoxylon sp. CI-4A]
MDSNNDYEDAIWGLGNHNATLDEDTRSVASDIDYPDSHSDTTVCSVVSSPDYALSSPDYSAIGKETDDEQLESLEAAVERTLLEGIDSEPRAEEKATSTSDSPHHSPSGSHEPPLPFISLRGPTDSSNLLDRHDRAMAQILTRFKNIIEAYTEPFPTTGNVLEHAALNRMRLESETNGLIAEVHGLIALSREIKALWIVGPLRQPGQDQNRESQLDQQALQVSRLYDQVVAMRDERIRQEARAQALAGASTSAASAVAGPSSTSGTGS